MARNVRGKGAENQISSNPMEQWQDAGSPHLTTVRLPTVQKVNVRIDECGLALDGRQVHLATVRRYEGAEKRDFFFTLTTLWVP